MHQVRVVFVFLGERVVLVLFGEVEDVLEAHFLLEHFQRIDEFLILFERHTLPQLCAYTVKRRHQRIHVRMVVVETKRGAHRALDAQAVHQRLGAMVTDPHGNPFTIQNSRPRHKRGCRSLRRR